MINNIIVSYLLISIYIIITCCNNNTSSMHQKNYYADSVSALLLKTEKKSKHIDTLKIITRNTWGAKQPVKDMKTHNIDRITIHHDADKISEKVKPIEKMQSLQKFSQSKNILGDGRHKPVWADVPYHFIIFPLGEISVGREIDYVGDTNTDYDPEGHILIDVAGNFEIQQPSVQQTNSLKKLCIFLCHKYNILPENINGHCDYTQTLCPGKNLKIKLPEIKDNIIVNLQKVAISVIYE